MRAKKSILVYCADRELLSASAFALRLHPYDVTAVGDARNAASLLMAGSSELACGVLIHAHRRDTASVRRLLDSDLHVPLLLVDRAGDLAPARDADVVLYGDNTSMAHILAALRVLCAGKRGPKPGSST